MSKIFPHFRMKLPKSLSSSFNILTVWAPRGGWVVWLCAVTVRGASRITYCIVQQLAAADPSLSNHFLSIHTLIILLLSPLHPGSASWFYQVGMLTVGLAGGVGYPIPCVAISEAKCCSSVRCHRAQFSWRGGSTCITWKALHRF